MLSPLPWLCHRVKQWTIFSANRVLVFNSSVCICVCVRACTSHWQAILRHQLGVLQFKSILTLSISNPIKLPPPRPHLCPSFRWQTEALDYHLCFWSTGSRLGLSMTPSLGLFNLLEWLTELTKIFYLLDHQVIMKGYYLETTRWKRYTGQGIGRGHRISLPFSGVSPSLFTNMEALWTWSFSLLTEA